MKKLRKLHRLGENDLVTQEIFDSLCALGEVFKLTQHWSEMYECLKSCHQYKGNEIWASAQLQEAKKGNMAKERVKKLESIGFK